MAVEFNVKQIESGWGASISLPGFGRLDRYGSHGCINHINGEGSTPNQAIKNAAENAIPHCDSFKLAYFNQDAKTWRPLDVDIVIDVSEELNQVLK